ncbi:MAG TPA: spore germination protein GerW family protein [Acidimicrobiales bacterium]
MTDEGRDNATSAVTDNLRGVRDALTVRRVFGEAYEVDGVTIIPVARVAGGGGGGGGEGTGPDDQGGNGFGTGFGINANPVGVYEVRDGVVDWKAAVDVNRLAKGGQVLAGIVAVCFTLVLLRRRR